MATFAPRLSERMEGFAHRLRKARGLDRAEPQVNLHYRRIYIIPTAVGLGFAIVLIIMLLVAMNYRLSLGYMLVFLLAGMGVATALHTFRNLHRLQIIPGRTEPVFAGDIAVMQVHVGSKGGLNRAAIRLNSEHDNAVPAHDPLDEYLDIEAGDSVNQDLRIRARKRGRLKLGRLRVETRYPLDLFRAWSWVDLQQSCLVYPHPAAKSTAFPTAPDGEGQGVGTSPGSGQEDFVGLREWRPGDNLSHVAWKALARGQGMMTKEFAGEARASLWLDFESIQGDTESRLSVLCRWVLDAHAVGERYGLRLPGVQLGPDEGEEHMRACLQSLALYGICADEPGTNS